LFNHSAQYRVQKVATGAFTKLEPGFSVDMSRKPDKNLFIAP